MTSTKAQLPTFPRFRPSTHSIDSLSKDRGISLISTIELLLKLDVDVAYHMHGIWWDVRPEELAKYARQRNPDQECFKSSKPEKRKYLWSQIYIEDSQIDRVLAEVQPKLSIVNPETKTSWSGTYIDQRQIDGVLRTLGSVQSEILNSGSVETATRPAPSKRSNRVSKENRDAILVNVLDFFEFCNTRGKYFEQGDLNASRLARDFEKDCKSKFSEDQIARVIRDNLNRFAAQGRLPLS